MPGHDNHLEYYRRELSYLRVESANFAARHPKVARRLVLSDAHSADPHIQHLIESVAFLTAGIHREIDGLAPAAAAVILDNLCPSLAQPVPSMTVMQMTLDPAEGKVTAGSKVAKGTLLSTTAASGEPCRFQVGWNTTLWPLQVADVVLEDARSLRLDLRTDAGVDLADLEVETLRLHLAGELMTTMPLHELVLCGLDYVEVVSSAGVQRLPAHYLREAGFAEDEAMLGSPSHVHPAYGLLQSYFAFPRAFQFFHLQGLGGRLGSGSGFSIRLTFTHGANVLALLRPEHIRLNCVPAINLFPVTSEPIAYDQRHYEYLLIANRKRDATTEVHSVVSVTVSDPRSERADLIPGVFADTGGLDDTDHIRGNAPLSWTMRRAASLRPGIIGSDVYLGFVDRRDVRAAHAEPVIYAKVLCTNRLLAEQVAPGTRFYGEGLASSTDIRALYQPSAQGPPAMESEALWALVSLLRLNHRSLVDGSAGVASLREMLGLFASNSTRDAVQVRGIRSLTASPGSAQLQGGAGSAAWRGHCRGTDIALEFAQDGYAGSSALMLASVLAHFFALYTTANSFVRLTVRRNGETWRTWPPMTGRQALL
ncbi:type VI secretion system baseplate subunit TssF [Massilia sp. CMS3.1]|uniref:type VI secretion system baseplate subunit TssF n=1 Tax=Massilia sp. CMS3.1 TaxID=3373083 RepID=UPI003EE7279A